MALKPPSKPLMCCLLLFRCRLHQAQAAWPSRCDVLQAALPHPHLCPAGQDRGPGGLSCSTACCTNARPAGHPPSFSPRPSCLAAMRRACPCWPLKHPLFAASGTIPAPFSLIFASQAITDCGSGAGYCINNPNAHRSAHGPSFSSSSHQTCLIHMPRTPHTHRLPAILAVLQSQTPALSSHCFSFAVRLIGCLIDWVPD